MKNWLPVLLLLISGAAVASERPDTNPWRLGVASSAAMSARESAFGVLAECERRFPELQVAGNQLRTSWLERNKDATDKLALLAEKLKARIASKYPEVDVNALLRQTDQAAQKATAELVAKITTGTLEGAPATQQLNTCKWVFTGMQQGKMDILNLQTTAKRVLQEDEISDFLQSYKGLTYEDGGDKFRASGTWIGIAFPLNETVITADAAERKMHITSKTLVAINDKIPPFMSESDETLAIESWDADAIRTEVQRAGKSQRYFQYVINRRTKEINKVFTGESPKTHVLGDVSQKINEVKAGFD
ncbi:hypothetical protein [Roseateles depolymerans]|nr:hypothetical protein [Roseateles depolymerans]